MCVHVCVCVCVCATWQKVICDERMLKTCIKINLFLIDHCDIYEKNEWEKNLIYELFPAFRTGEFYCFTSDDSLTESMLEVSALLAFISKFILRRP